MKYVIIGGVAAGAGAAARLRRLDEKADIILLERGRSISYANCGLPYHIGGVIAERDNLLVMPAARFKAWFNVDVRTENEVTAIDRPRKTLRIRGPEGEYTENYDKLLIATGALPADDSVAAPELPHVMHLWTLADMDRVISGLAAARKVAVVGAGFIGLETAENLRRRNLEVVLLQRSNHVLPTLDPEMAQPLASELRRLGIDLRFGRTVSQYREEAAGVELTLDNGDRLTADAVIVSTGVTPNSALAREAGLECGPRGHIVVDSGLRTSDPDIYAAGDVVEVVEPVFGGKTAIPLAGPANKQGRIAADNLAGGHSVYRGTFGASVVKVGDLTAAAVGLTENALRRLNRPCRKLYLHPSSGASYYPGAARLSIKLLFGDDGTIYGAQIVGAKGVDKRIDTIAQAMRNGLKAPELGELELAYAPPYSSAKDPVNFAGFIAENLLTGRSDAVYPDQLPADALIVDVRTAAEHELGGIPGAVNIPLDQLRSRLDELDRNRLIVVHCQVGLRGYLAERILKQNGFRAANLSGGWVTWKMFHPDPPAAAPPAVAPVAAAPPAAVAAAKVLDVRALPCPGPVVKLKTALDVMASGEVLHLLAAPTFEGDLNHLARAARHTVVNLVRREDRIEADVIKDGGAAVISAPESPVRHSAAIVLFSNDFDKATAALILAGGLAASGAEVTIFFTFWGLSVLRRNPAPAARKPLLARLFGLMLPRGAEKLNLSKMNMLGMGTFMMKRIMKQKKVLTLPELIQTARANGVKFIACDMAMDVMGITREELIDVDEVAGVAAFAELAGRCNNTFFI